MSYKVPYEKLDHVISTGRNGKGNNKRYAFNDFSDLKNVKGLFPNEKEPKRKPRKKTHKKRDNFGLSIQANQTHILIPCEPRVYTNLAGKEKVMCEQWVVLHRILPPGQVMGMYPNAMELFYSYDGVAFPDNKFSFANVK